MRITAKGKAGAALKAATVVTDTVKEVRTVDGATVRAEDILSAS